MFPNYVETYRKFLINIFDLMIRIVFFLYPSSLFWCGEREGKEDL